MGRGRPQYGRPRLQHRKLHLWREYPAGRQCIRGTLTDIGIPNGPTTGPIFGTIVGNQVTFSFRYTYTGEIQGLRTFTGFIGRSGAVSGTWSETGPENGHGTWALANRADRACSPHVLRWLPWRLCPVHH